MNDERPARRDRTLVGFGLSPTQGALFVYEAFASGNFSKFIIAETDHTLVYAVRLNLGAFTVNLAFDDHVERATLRGVDIYDPNNGDDRFRLVEALVDADEIVTALPSVDHYHQGGNASPVALISDALTARTKPGIIYTAEGIPNAAEFLAHFLEQRGSALPPNLQVVNTVIGKMSHTISDARTIDKLDVAPLTPSTPRAVIAEANNRIIVSPVARSVYDPGLQLLDEKEALLPFEHARRYAHQAAYALLGYLADVADLSIMSDVAGQSQLMQVAREALINECGPALVASYQHIGDPLFTHAGFAAYADDVLKRITRVNLHLPVATAVRHHRVQLGYDEPLIGAMRMSLAHGVSPTNLARGAAAAVISMLSRHEEVVDLPDSADALDAKPGEKRMAALLREIWADSTDSHERTIVKMVWDAFDEMA